MQWFGEGEAIKHSFTINKKSLREEKVSTKTSTENYGCDLFKASLLAIGNLNKTIQYMGGCNWSLSWDKKDFITSYCPIPKNNLTSIALYADGNKAVFNTCGFQGVLFSCTNQTNTIHSIVSLFSLMGASVGSLFEKNQNKTYIENFFELEFYSDKLWHFFDESSIYIDNSIFNATSELYQDLNFFFNDSDINLYKLCFNESKDNITSKQLSITTPLNYIWVHKSNPSNSSFLYYDLSFDNETYNKNITAEDVVNSFSTPSKNFHSYLPSPLQSSVILSGALTAYIFKSLYGLNLGQNNNNLNTQNNLDNNDNNYEDKDNHGNDDDSSTSGSSASSSQRNCVTPFNTPPKYDKLLPGRNLAGPFTRSQKESLGDIQMTSIPKADIDHVLDDIFSLFLKLSSITQKITDDFLSSIKTISFKMNLKDTDSENFSRKELYQQNFDNLNNIKFVEPNILALVFRKIMNILYDFTPIQNKFITTKTITIDETQSDLQIAKGRINIIELDTINATKLASFLESQHLDILMGKTDPFAHIELITASDITNICFDIY